MHRGSDPALQGTALVNRNGAVPEQYVTLVSIASLPVRLHWNSDCVVPVLLVQDEL